MAKRVGVDKWLFGTVLLLVLFGLVSVFSASAVMAKETMGSPYAFVAKQAVWALLGLVVMAWLMQVDYNRYNKYPVVVGALAVTALLLLGVFAMHGMNGAHRWIRRSRRERIPQSVFAAPPIRCRASLVHARNCHSDVVVAAAAPSDSQQGFACGCGSSGFCGGTERNAEMSNWVSDGLVAAFARSGRKEKGPTASRAATAATSAPPCFRIWRRVMCR